MSAISLLKLYNEADGSSLKINDAGILQAAISIGCHDEDIWEALCGCQGYRKTIVSRPSTREKCAADSCKRYLWSAKSAKIYNEKIYEEKEKLATGASIDESKLKCESWEWKFMKEEFMKRIKFEDYPILFLLIFCDNVQDDGRVTSSDDMVSKDLSSIEDINIETKKKKQLITVNLRADSASQKEEEIERLSWFLFDDRFSISINGKPPIKLNRA